MALREPTGTSLSDVVCYKLVLEYDGTDFLGWQIQPAGRTVQACLQDALRLLFRGPVRVVAAARTDAGVHAVAQVAHFRASVSREPHTLLRALNALLPPDIRILRVDYAGPQFHARFSARWRGYRYRIALQPLAVGRQYVWECPFALSVPPMEEAASLLLGEHDFRSFAHASPSESHYLASVFRCEWRRCGPFLDFHIEANRFLHGMVRLLVGTFVQVGRGKIGPQQVGVILERRDVRLAGPKAPARGLTLTAVGYNPWPNP